jgi:hypothetical protein
LSNAKNASVSAITIREAGSNFVEEELDGLLVAKQLYASSPGSDGWRNRVAPLLPLVARTPLLPFRTSAFRIRGELLGVLLMLQRPTGDRDTAFNERADFFRLVQRCGDASLHFRSIVIKLGIAFGEDETAGKVPQHRSTVTWGAAEYSASSSVSHGSCRMC